MKKPRILILDIETSPLITYTWGIFEQDIGLNQIIEDWYILSYAAKVLGENKIYYGDQSKEKDIKNDKRIVQELWKLLDEADIIIGQNLKQFDTKKIKARMLFHGLKPPSSFHQIDTLKIMRKHFGFTSNKLEFLSNKLCESNKKSSHKKFSGFELWKECLKKNKAAWAEMKKYNIKDVLATEELYLKIRPWDNSYNPNLWENSPDSNSTVNKKAVDKNYIDRKDTVCSCGSTKIHSKGYEILRSGKYRKFQCTECGANWRSTKNTLGIEKRRVLKIPM